jgi:hypothetical protein
MSGSFSTVSENGLKADASDADLNIGQCVTLLARIFPGRQHNETLTDLSTSAPSGDGSLAVSHQDDRVLFSRLDTHVRDFFVRFVAIGDTVRQLD